MADTSSENDFKGYRKQAGPLKNKSKGVDQELEKMQEHDKDADSILDMIIASDMHPENVVCLQEFSDMVKKDEDVMVIPIRM